MPIDRPPPPGPPESFVLSCSHCRLVRTAGADWSHGPPPAGARVSHGICPPCLVEHYPGVRLPGAPLWGTRAEREVGPDPPQP